MKKILIIFILFLVCGCKNKLTCTYEENYNDIKIKNKIIFNFKDNTYKQTDIMIFKTEEDADKYFSEIKEYIELYNLTLEKNKIISIIEDEIKLKGSRKELKKEYESYDYSCK